MFLKEELVLYKGSLTPKKTMLWAQIVLSFD